MCRDTISGIVPDRRNAIIEARSNEYPEWDSDYVGDVSMPVFAARHAIAEMECDPEWEGWEFQILADDGDGHYRIVVE